MTNSGSIKGPGSTLFNRSETQIINGTSDINNRTSNNTSGAFISRGAGNNQSI